ncbi:MAG: polysaccharide pyruvyl transferase family protein, partial [Planctomycetaceae bacterium]|nr:polysaccharide pyruvyl transferase family protein [Planctomycetaceae bacterium]
MQRRSFLRSSVSSAAGLAVSATPIESAISAITGSIAAERAPRILLRSSWQTVNIGDIAHTPGVLSLLRRHLPEAEITLWPSNIDNGVD